MATSVNPPLRVAAVLLVLVAAVAGCSAREAGGATPDGPMAAAPVAAEGRDAPIPSRSDASPQIPSRPDASPEIPIPSRPDASPEISVPATDACPSIRHRLAQLLLVGFPGAVPTPDNLGMVEAGIGGIVLFSFNIEDGAQVRDLVGALAARARLPLEVAVDQEPGRIARLAGIVDPLPPARELGTADPAHVRSVAEKLAGQLADLGVTTNLAPVLDVTGAAPNTVIGDRSFGADPATVTAAGLAFMEGLQAGGVEPVVKHFPGHGESAVDSHVELPTVLATRAELEVRALGPFRAAVAAGAPAVMVGHLLVPAVDPDLPATLSPAVIAMLRHDLGFDGRIVSDALEMGALAQRWDLPVAAEMALSAGVDQLIFWREWWRLGEVLDHLEAAVSAGRLDELRITTSFGRVLEGKGAEVPACP